MPTTKFCSQRPRERRKKNLDHGTHSFSFSRECSTLRLLGASLSIATMARRYDSRTTIFSPEGRLYQVEYAMEAISNAGAALGVLASDGVVLAAEKRITSKVRRV